MLYVCSIVVNCYILTYYVHAKYVPFLCYTCVYVALTYNNNNIILNRINTYITTIKVMYHYKHGMLITPVFNYCTFRLLTT